MRPRALLFASLVLSFGLTVAAEEAPSMPSFLEGDPELADLWARAHEAPDDACAANDLGIALSRRNLLDESIEVLRRSAEVSPDPVVYNNLGTVYLSAGRNRSATSAFRSAVDLDPTYAAAWYNLGAAYEAREKSEKAITSYQRAMSLDPSLGDPAVNPKVLNNRYLIAVRVLRYGDTAGSPALPLQDCPAGASPSAP